MTFTDEDLKRLKDSMGSPINDHTYLKFEIKDLRALLSRLEAAEAVCLDLEELGLQDRKHEDLLEAWRKEAGK